MRCHNRLAQTNGLLLCDSAVPDNELDCSLAQLDKTCAECDENNEMYRCDQRNTQCLVARWRSALQAEELSRA
jgi:hypothetical protein